MSLNATDKSVVAGFWKKMAPKAAEMGGDSLARMLAAYPQTKIYFTHFTDLGPNSAQVKKHGANMMNAVGDAVSKIDDLVGGLAELGELHALKLRLDPANHKTLFHNMMLVMAVYFPADFTPEVHVSMDKFLQQIALDMSEKYR
ncbi:hemoglobin subunit alpha-A-like [Salarias fasciatus]|uniref:Hemoglobin subunit alpha-A-like n=1 Tax=Salarias fasciatus TaxID=181472 RepID=A0A672G8R0_SALFA|nr:hemoglobin subunit alpha-A-like [Salarias fasciatus]